MEKNFKNLLLAQSTANIADVFFRVSVISNIFMLTKSVMATSMIPVIIGISSFISSFFLPVITRNKPLNEILFFTQFVKTINIVSLFTIVFFLGNAPVWVIYILVCFISFMDGFAGPVSSAIIPKYSSNLTRANSLLSTSNEATQIVGWALGGILLTIIGFYKILIITIMLFILATIMFFRLPAVIKEVMENETTKESLIKGWKLIFKIPKLKIIMLVNLFEILANSIWVSSIILVFVNSILHKSDEYWGYVNTAYSIGIISSGLFIAKYTSIFDRKKSLWIISSLLVSAIFIFLGVSFINPICFLLISFIIGIFSQLKEIPETIIIQEAVNEDELVNIYSVLEVVSTVSFSLFIFIMSFFTDTFGVMNTFKLAACCLIVESAIIYINRKILDKS